MLVEQKFIKRISRSFNNGNRFLSYEGTLPRKLVIYTLFLNITPWNLYKSVNLEMCPDQMEGLGVIIKTML